MKDANTKFRIWHFRHFSVLTFLLFQVGMLFSQDPCSNLSIVPGGGNITISGHAGSPVSMIQIFDSSWVPVFNCSGNCTVPNQTIPNLAAGQYYVKVDLLSSSWQPVCKKEGFYQVTTGGGSTGGGSSVLTCPPLQNVIVTAAAGQSSAIVTFSQPTATTTCAGGAVNITQSNGLSSGSAFPIGTSQVCYRAADNCGNQSEHCFNVIVNPSASLPTLVINDLTVNENAGVATVTVSVSGSTAYPVSVQYSSSNGTAYVGSDFSSVSGTLTIPAGATSATISVPIIDDLVSESNESFALTLTNATNGSIFDNSGTVTIVDNDTPSGGANTDCNAISFSANNGSIAISGLGAPIVMIQAFDAVWAPVFSKTYTNQPGSISIPNLGSGTYFVKVDFLNASWGSLCKKEQYITVSNSGGTPVMPTLSINDLSVTENSGTASLTVSLSTVSTSPVTVEYTTSNGTATTPSDYTVKSGIVTIPAGSTSATVTISIVDDLIAESTESLNITLTNPSNATIADNTGIVSISDNDNNGGGTGTPNCNAIVVSSGNGSINVSELSAPVVMLQVFNSTWVQVFNQTYTSAPGTVTIPNLPAGSYFVKADFLTANWTAICNKEQFITVTNGGGTSIPSLSISDITVNENAGTASLNVSLSSISTMPVSVLVSTSNSSALSGTDYSVMNTTVSIPAGQSSVMVTIPIIDDAVTESNETFNVSLTSPTGATINDGSGVVTILDNDIAPAAANCNTIVYTLGSGNIVISNLSNPGGITMIQAFNSSWNAVFNEYYTTTPSSVTIPGLTSGNYWVKVQYLTSSWSELCKKEQAVTISGGNPAPTVSINDVTVNENAGTATLTISQSTTSNSPVTVLVSSSNGSALSGSDYTPSSVTATIPAGSLTTTVSFPIIDDSMIESTEQFNVTLSNPNGSIIADGTGSVTILDNDITGALPVLSINDITVLENAGTANLTVSIPTPSNTPISFVVTTTNASAIAGSDYSMVTTTATIPAGSTSVVVSVPLLDDATLESDEQFFASISSPNGATIGDGSGTVTILDNDYAVSGVVTLTCPADITVTIGTNATSSIVNYPVPTASTTCPGGFVNKFITSGLASGSSFPVGTTQVCYVATDNCSNSTSCCFSVKVFNQGCVNVDNPGTISGDETALCSGSFDPAPITSVSNATGGTGTLEYQWICATTGCPNLGSTLLHGATGASFDPPVQTDSVVYYARLARRVGCNNNSWQISNCIKKEKKTDALLAQWDFVQCVNESSTGANAFTADGAEPSYVAPCAAFDVSSINRRNAAWSGTCPNIGLGARCRPGGYLNFSFIDPNYATTSNSALIFNVAVGGGSGSGKLTSLEIVQRGGTTEPLLLNNCGRVPPPVRVDPYAVRILKNGIEIYRKVDVPISPSSWNTDLFQFCSNNAFNYVPGDIFTFELQAYDAGLAANQEFVWSVDDIKLRGTCSTELASSITTGNCPSRTATLVVENANSLVVDEEFLKSVLVKKGFNVTVRSNSTISAADVNGKNLVVLSPEIQVSNINIIPQSTSPMLVFGCIQRAFLANRMASVDQTADGLQFTAPYFYTGAQPISASLNGEAKTFNTESRIHFDVRPTLLAQTISYWGADVSQASGRNVVFSYDMGDLMAATPAYYHGVPTANQLVPARDAINAPNRRVGLAWGRNFSAHILPNAITVMNEAIDWAASCASGNSGAALTMNCIPDINIVAQSGATSAVVNYTPPTASTLCPNATIHLDRVTGFGSGYAFPVGTTQVCYTATDACGNTKTCCFNVNVIDGKIGCNNVTNAGLIGGEEVQACSGSFDPSLISNLQLPTGGTNDIEYAWVCSYNSCPTVNSQRVLGAYGATFDPGVQTVPVIYYARLARRAGCQDSDWQISNCIRKENSGAAILAQWDFSTCTNNASTGVNAFTSNPVSPSYTASCAAFDISDISRRNATWSGTCPNIGLGGRCRPGGYMNFSFTESAYSSTSPATLVFNVAVGGAANPGRLSSMEIVQRAGVNEPLLLNNCGRIPAPIRVDPYAVRVLKNGVEIFKKIDVPISAVSWNKDLFQFCTNPAFNYVAGDLFTIELMAYDGGLGLNEEMIWSVDDIKLRGTCSSEISAIITPSTCSNKNAILVVENSTSLVPDEAFIKKALEKKGFAVTVRSNSSIVNADVNGKDLVVLSPEITMPNIATIPQTTSPMIVFGCIQHAFLANRMSSVDATANTAFFTNPYVFNNNHYIASGLVGQQQVFNTESRIHFNNSPSALATTISYWGTDPNQAPGRNVVFAYEMGALMPATPAFGNGDAGNSNVAARPALNAPNRRVGFAWGRNFSAYITPNAAKMVNDAIDWAARCLPNLHSTVLIDELTFSANKDGLVSDLRWLSNTGDRNDYFVVERAGEGSDFEALTKVDGSGVKDEILHFELQDKKPLEGDNYYRLKLVMKDASVKYSQVVKIHFPTINGFMLYPNPASEKVSIAFDSNIAEEAHIELVNQLGGVVKEARTAEGVDTVEIDLSGVENGLYFMRITVDGNRPLVRKLVVENLK